MATNIGLFDYELPESFIAQRSVEPRDSSKLMVVDRATGELEHRHFYDIVDLLRSGDVLVFNTSKVFKARLVDHGIEVVRPKEGQSVRLSTRKIVDLEHAGEHCRRDGS